MDTSESRVVTLDIKSNEFLKKIVLRYGAFSYLGPIAQSVEQRTFNPWVDGSSPSGPTCPNL